MSEILGDDALAGLDISSLMGGESKEMKEESTPSIGNPALDIKEVEELPTTPPKVDPLAGAVVESNEEDNEEEVVEEKEVVKDQSIEIEDQGSPVVTPDTTENSPLRVFAEMQREKGLIDFKDEEYEDNEEFLLSKVKGSIDSGVNEYKDNLPPEIKYLVDNYEEGVPLHDLINLSSQQQEYESIPAQAIQKDQELQRALVRDLLYRGGWDQDKINAKVQRYVDSGVLEAEAMDAHSSLMQIQKREKENYVKQVKADNAKKVEMHNQWLSDLEKHITDKEEVISGISITPKQRKELYSNITRVDKDGKNAIMKAREADPEFDLKVAYMATILNWDLSALKRTSKTKATRSLVNSLSSRRPSNKVENDIVDFGIMKKSL